MRRGESALNVVLWIAISALLAAAVFRTRKFAPLTRSLPRTVVSNGSVQFYEPLLGFLSDVSTCVPDGSTFSLVPPSGRDPANWLDYMIAVGQLPGRRVIFARRFLPAGPPSETPRFVGCYRGDFSDPRFVRVRRFAEGDLYEAAR